MNLQEVETIKPGLLLVMRRQDKWALLQVLQEESMGTQTYWILYVLSFPEGDRYLTKGEQIFSARAIKDQMLMVAEEP
jgi:hypothetical protein